MSMRILGKIGILAVALCLAGTIIGCTAHGAADGEGMGAAEAVSKLEQAKKIRLSKDMLSLGDHWQVFADNEKVADIDGEFIKIWDCYVMRSTNGEFICGEQENFALITASAAKIDEQGNEIGRYNQNLSFLLLRMEYLNENGDTVATLEENLDFALDCYVKDADGNDAWHADKKLLSLSADIEITPQSASAEVPVTDAIMMVAIANELGESSSNDE